MDGALRLRVRAGRYKKENEISDVGASRDLRKMADAELLIPHGERRGIYYTGSKKLIGITARHKSSGRAGDPYEIVRQKTIAAEAPERPPGHR